MATNRSQVRTKFTQEMRTDTSNKIWTPTIINDLFSQAYLQIQKDGFFQWDENQGGSQTVTFLNGTREYSFSPDTVGKINVVLLSDGTELTPTDFETVIRRNPTSTTGTPDVYYIRAGRIGFDPVPNASVATATVYHNYKLAAPTDDVTNLTLDDSLVPLIVKYMAYLAWCQPGGNSLKAQEKLQQYQDRLNDLLSSNQLTALQTVFIGVPRRGTGRSNPKALGYRQY